MDFCLLGWGNIYIFADENAGVMKRIVVLGLFIVLLSRVAAQQQAPLRLLTWNLENLFDTEDDVGFADEEFLPEGPRHWTKHRYWEKMTEVARVVAAVAEEGGLPSLIGLCEVENDSVLRALTKRSVMRHLGYDYVMTHSEDARGIDVALLYQPARFRLLEHHDIRVPSQAHGLHATRDILYAKGLVLTSQGGVDTLHVMVVHLPSRTSGQQGDRNRRLAADVLWHTVDSIVGNRAGTAAEPRIVAMGDFNADSHDRIFKRAPLRLTDDSHAAGTYCFQGFWEWLDHILVSASVEPVSDARPLKYPWLLEGNKSYGGQMPRRTFRGTIYHGGISDHLPVLLDLQL